jgi:hypothetical protein
MLFPYKNDNIKDHVCMDNMIFIMVRQVFSNILNIISLTISEMCIYDDYSTRWILFRIMPCNGQNVKEKTIHLGEKDFLSYSGS